jgi:ATP-dependent helicase HrpB
MPAGRLQDDSHRHAQRSKASFRATVNIALPDLPIREALPRLAQTMRESARALLCAPPGAGKSTVVPLMLLDCEWLGRAKILMLEPRRIAARAVARRMASLLGEPAGERVGYRTRLETKVSARTRIEVVTEGILTRLLQEDASLPGIGCVIFDEFHERSLNADLGLALSLDVQENLRADLKLLVMSATLDAAPLQALMIDAPMVQSLGRSFGVETVYVARRAEQNIEQHTAQTIRRALGEYPGDVLCFLPGAREIRRVSDLLATTLQDRSVNVLPLYGDLSSAAQDAALDPAPAGQRKVVLATSIAETSLTIEGVRIVVDAGLQRSIEFDPATGMSRLTTGKVSQAASDQRRGRAGRLAHGVCYRLWAAGAQAALAAHTPAEITRADLAPLALELKCWGCSDAATLRWLDPPPAAPLAQAHDLLRSLEAIDSAGRVTPHGRALVRVGAHPRLAHMLVKASRIGAGRLAADIAAVLSERDILRRGAATGDADLRLRIAVLRGNRHDLPSGMSVDARALQQAKSVSALWQRGIARSADEADPHILTGVILALAYPDRIASARGQTGRFLLANGRGAAFASADALARSELRRISAL